MVGNMKRRVACVVEKVGEGGRAMQDVPWRLRMWWRMMMMGGSQLSPDSGATRRS